MIIRKLRRVGDVVMHKNGQRMTIAGVYPNTYRVQWFDPFGVLQSSVFAHDRFE